MSRATEKKLHLLLIRVYKHVIVMHLNFYDGNDINIIRDSFFFFFGNNSQCEFEKEILGGYIHAHAAFFNRHHVHRRSLIFSSRCLCFSKNKNKFFIVFIVFNVHNTSHNHVWYRIKRGLKRTLRHNKSLY